MGSLAAIGLEPRAASHNVATSHKRSSASQQAAARKVPPIKSGLGGIASADQMSIFSAISIASSTSMPR